MIMADMTVQDAVDIVRPVSSQDAIMCDLDGTLSLLNGRDPYKPETCNDDMVNKAVARVLEIFHAAGYKIVFLSGREETYKPQTISFLTKAVTFVDYMLFMRKAEDYRKDSIIKNELYDKEVKDWFNIIFAMDDRNQVVDMWRDEVGLTCFQVAEGDF